MPLPLRKVAKVARADQPNANLPHRYALIHRRLANTAPLPEHAPQDTARSTGSDRGRR